MTKKEKKAYTKFRHFLLDEGFEMSQFSVYLRFCAGKEQADAFTRRVERNVPETGKVQLRRLHVMAVDAADQERAYAARLAREQGRGGDVELFEPRP